jgi:tartrate-resistant acid phosphatase type 5
MTWKRWSGLMLAVVCLSRPLVLAVGAGANDVRAVDQEPITFAVIGDFGKAGPYEQAVADLVKSWNPAFILTTGDNNYPSGAAATIDLNIGQYYQTYIAPYTGAFGSGAATNRFFPTLGNHDWDTSGAAPYFDYFSLPGNERYYDVVLGPVHVFSLDSDPREPDGTSSTSTQGGWLRTKLAGSTACWKLVYFHHAPYSSGSHGSDVRMQWPFLEWGADAVLAGHDHTYERVLVGGLPYFVNGLGGYSRYPFGTPIDGSVVRYNAGFGAMRVTASNTTITYEFVAASGMVVDSYTETGGCGPPATPTSTATPTPTPTSAPTPTATPSACLPRPPIRVTASRNGAGALLVTLSTTGNGGQITAVRFGQARNALIDVPGGPLGATGNFNVALSSAGSGYTFTVRRAVPGQIVHVPFVVVDACGDWSTFVGGGPASF